MVWSEDVGIISQSEYPDDKFWWTLPNCLASCDPYCPGKEVVTANSSVICSPWFFSYNTKWRLALIRYSDSNQDYCGMFLWKMTSSTFSRKLTVKLGLFDSSTEQRQFSGELNSHGCFGKWDFLHISEFNVCAREISADGFLRIFCKMQLKTEDIPEVPATGENEDEKNDSEDSTVEKMPETKGVDRLVEDLKNLLTNGQRSDVILKVGDREFKVHRNILIVRSPVFASMLQHDTKENATGIVDIPDCSPEAFEVFLSYVYTGSVAIKSSDNIFDLYYAADKYQVNDLKSDCVEYMEENLSIENFCDVITLALQHTESGLQKKATRFFCDNVKAIIKTVQWQNYVKDYPIQANELYIKAINA